MIKTIIFLFPFSSKKRIVSDVSLVILYESFLGFYKLFWITCWSIWLLTPIYDIFKRLSTTVTMHLRMIPLMVSVCGLVVYLMLLSVIQTTQRRCWIIRNWLKTAVVAWKEIRTILVLVFRKCGKPWISSVSRLQYPQLVSSQNHPTYKSDNLQIESTLTLF